MCSIVAPPNIELKMSALLLNHKKLCATSIATSLAHLTTVLCAIYTILELLIVRRSVC